MAELNLRVTCKCSEFCKSSYPAHLYVARRSVTVLGNDDLGDIALVLITLGLIIFVSVKEDYGILDSGPRES